MAAVKSALSVFISYAHEDELYRQALVKALAPLRREGARMSTTAQEARPSMKRFVVLLPLHRVPGMALPGHVRAAAYHGRAQQRTSSPEHHCLLAVAVLHAFGQGEAEGLGSLDVDH